MRIASLSALGDGKVLKGPDYFPPDVAGVLGIGRREVGGGAGS